MDEIEVPTEHLHEAIHEKVEEAGENSHVGKNWSMPVAISTALMAVFAAISSLLAGHHSNEALVDQIRASDQWSFYQAKGIKAEIKAMGLVNGSTKPEEMDRYKKEQDEIKKGAEELQQSSGQHLESEKKFAVAVTFFQVAIAIAAIAILSKKKPLWVVSLFISSIGLLSLIYGIVSGNF
jgi:hypothetical protein